LVERGYSAFRLVKDLEKNHSQMNMVFFMMKR
jgi:hypothetical protein